MTVNLTLLVQIMHTLCAYFLFDRLLLRKLYAAYCEEKAYKARLADELAETQKVLQSRENAQQEQWNGFRKAFEREIPASGITSDSLYQIDLTPRNVEVSDKQVNQLVDRVKSEFLQRITHD
jgi:flagellar motility protein MotE (MotC chaperone)